MDEAEFALKRTEILQELAPYTRVSREADLTRRRLPRPGAPTSRPQAGPAATSSTRSWSSPRSEVEGRGGEGGKGGGAGQTGARGGGQVTGRWASQCYGRGLPHLQAMVIELRLEMRPAPGVSGRGLPHLQVMVIERGVGDAPGLGRRQPEQRRARGAYEHRHLVAVTVVLGLLTAVVPVPVPAPPRQPGAGQPPPRPPPPPGPPRPKADSDLSLAETVSDLEAKVGVYYVFGQLAPAPEQADKLKACLDKAEEAIRASTRRSDFGPMTWQCLRNTMRQ